jgi:hypothetical protein
MSTLRDRAGGEGVVDGRSRFDAPSSPARVGPAGRLDELRRALAGSEDITAILGFIGKLRDLAGKVIEESVLFDNCIAAIVLAEKKGGRLLLAGASAELTKYKANRWRSLAQMTASELGADIKRTQAEARRRRENPPGVPADRMVTTRWVVDQGTGIRTRWRAGLGPDDDAQAVERKLLDGLPV